jgi:hypothetical protein
MKAGTGLGTQSSRMRVQRHTCTGLDATGKRTKPRQRDGRGSVARQLDPVCVLCAAFLEFVFCLHMYVPAVHVWMRGGGVCVREGREATSETLEQQRPPPLPIPPPHHTTRPLPSSSTRARVRVPVCKKRRKQLQCPESLKKEIWLQPHAQFPRISLRGKYGGEGGKELIKQVSTRAVREVRE